MKTVPSLVWIYCTFVSQTWAESATIPEFSNNMPHNTHMHTYSKQAGVFSDLFLGVCDCCSIEVREVADLAPQAGIICLHGAQSWGEGCQTLLQACMEHKYCQKWLYKQATHLLLNVTEWSTQGHTCLSWVPGIQSTWSTKKNLSSLHSATI